MRRVIVYLILTCVAGLGQTGRQKAAAPGKAAPAGAASQGSTAGYPIESITVEGNSAYSRDQILTVAGLKVGQRVTKADLEAARDRLSASAAFEMIDFRFAPAPSKNGYAVTFRVAEAGPFYPVVFEGLAIQDAQARAALKRSDPLFGARIPPTQAKIDRYAAVLEEALAVAGKPGKVVGRVAPEDSGALAVIFQPNTPVARIARVRFTGNKAVPSTQLENAMNVVAVGQPWREKQVRQLLDTTIRPIYDARGRVGVEFPKIDAVQDPKVDGVVLTVAVDEGETFTISAVTVQGVPDAGPLVKAMKLNKGDLFNGEAVQEGATRIENMLKREGHMRAKTRIERKLDRKARTVSVNIVAEPGPQFRFGKLNIEGLDVTTEPVIRKLWSVKQGAPFNADYPDYFLTQLREEGYFENLGKTQSKVSLDEENRVADVTLIFHAAPVEPEKKQP